MLAVLLAQGLTEQITEQHRDESLIMFRCQHLKHRMMHGVSLSIGASTVEPVIIISYIYSMLCVTRRNTSMQRLLMLTATCCGCQP
jgi:hypothetical protein